MAKSLVNDLLDALPNDKKQTVSLLDALPDPNDNSFLVVDYESKPSLLQSHEISISAAEQFAIISHQEEQKKSDAVVVNSKKRKASKPLELPNKKKEKRIRGKQIKARSRGNQRRPAKS